MRLERRDGVAVLTLEDPERRNALSAPLVAGITGALDEIESDPGIGALVVTGAPPAFCAGADLSDLAARGDDLDDAGAAEGLRAVYEGFLRVAASPLPTVAAVNGPAVGAGLNLAMACDVRIAAESAVFDARFLALGLHPGGGGSWLLHQALGPQGAAALVLFGQRVDGRRAAEIGLAWCCVDDDEVVDAALELARPAAEAPRELARRVKATLRGWHQVTTHAAAVEAEIGPQVWSLHQPEFQSRLAALRARVASSPPG